MTVTSDSHDEDISFRRELSRPLCCISRTIPLSHQVSFSERAKFSHLLTAIRARLELADEMAHINTLGGRIRGSCSVTYACIFGKSGLHFEGERLISQG